VDIVPVYLVIAANAIVLSGYIFVFLVLRKNSYASRIIEVEKGPKVITTGPYAPSIDNVPIHSARSWLLLCDHLLHAPDHTALLKKYFSGVGHLKRI
jgi:hypothetical protein